VIFCYDIIDKETIEIHIRMEADDGTVGEGIHELHPGEDFMGITFDEFIANGTGEMDIGS